MQRGPVPPAPVSLNAIPNVLGCLLRVPVARLMKTAREFKSS